MRTPIIYTQSQQKTPKQARSIEAKQLQLLPEATILNKQIQMQNTK